MNLDSDEAIEIIKNQCKLIGECIDLNRINDSKLPYSLFRLLMQWFVKKDFSFQIFSGFLKEMLERCEAMYKEGGEK